jgi:hypothetical protein
MVGNGKDGIGFDGGGVAETGGAELTGAVGVVVVARLTVVVVLNTLGSPIILLGGMALGSAAGKSIEG